MLFELRFSGKTSEEKYAASLGTKAKQIFFLISAITSGSVYALRTNLLNIMIHRKLLGGRGTSIINEVKRIE